jgi:hypothetical protein
LELLYMLRRLIYWTGIAWFAIGVGILAPEVGHANAPSYYMISSSDSDPWVNVGDAFFGEQTLYLWIVPSYVAGAFDFGIVSSFDIVELVTLNGFVNQGTMQSPLLTRDTCVDDLDGEVAARIVVADPTGTGGTICFERSAISNRLCGELCGGGLDSWTWFDYIGFATGGVPPCWGLKLGSECDNPFSTDATTWGRTKASYR